MTGADNTHSVDHGERYEAIEIIVRRPAEGPSWLDQIHDLISAACDGESSADECPCGLQVMGGTEGTLEQCCEWNDPDVLLAKRLRKRMAEDDGTRYSLGEVAEMFGVDLNDDEAEA